MDKYASILFLFSIEQNVSDLRELSFIYINWWASKIPSHTKTSISAFARIKKKKYEVIGEGQS